jgi:hypothetical protein
LAKESFEYLLLKEYSSMWRNREKSSAYGVHCSPAASPFGKSQSGRMVALSSRFRISKITNKPEEQIPQDKAYFESC